MAVNTRSPNRSDSDWQTVAQLRPQLKSDVVIHPQTYRNQRWYVISRPEPGKFLRINEQAYALVARLKGLKVVEIKAQIARFASEPAPEDRYVIDLIAQLYSAGLLKENLSEQGRRVLLRRAPLPAQLSFMQRFNPLAIRVPLGNPDRLIGTIIAQIPGGFRFWALLWCLVTGSGILLGLLNADNILMALNSDVISPGYLLQITGIFVLMKLIHEFAHGMAVKVWGGEVREMGIALLVLAPIPYTDTSSAWRFQDKRKRILVGLAGMIAELFIAAIALCVWLITAPGMVNDLALQTFIIGAVSSLLFNANPFLKFDGYYVLQDWIEVPNLYSRSARYYLYLIQRFVLGIESARSPVSAAGEAGWFTVYGILALFNRLFLLVVIVLFLMDSFLVIGVVLAIWAVLTQLIVPLLNGLVFLFSSNAMQGLRSRGLSILSVVLILAYLLLGHMPVMLKTHSEGVVWVMPQAEIYSGADGFVEQILVSPGSYVEAGQPLLRLNPDRLQARIDKLQARDKELRVLIAAQSLERKYELDITRMDLATVQAQMTVLEAQRNALEIRAKVAGEFVLPEAEYLIGRYIERGTLLGYIYSPENRVVRVAVTQQDIGLIQQQTERAEIRVASHAGRIIPSYIERQQPAGSNQLPNKVLGAAGGGALAVYGTGNGLNTTENVFLVDLALPEAADVAGIGERAYIRFIHGEESLLLQWLRRTKQLLLGQQAVLG